MRVAPTKLGARTGNTDSASLQRELDSLRSYRDVLHETMRGLVEKSQGKLAPGDGPELANALVHVAELLAAFVSAQKQQTTPPVEDTHALVAQAELAARSAAEAELSARTAEFQRETAAHAEQRAAVEAQRDSAARQLAHHRNAHRQCEAAASGLQAEAAALDASLVSLAASHERERRDAACRGRDVNPAACSAHL